MSEIADARPGEQAEERQDEPQPQPFRGPEQPPGEIDGPPGPEPTRFGDWEKGGRCSDF
jgi:hypothetical protein